jgi:quinoprotein glucose dehydrogenase
VPDIDNRPSLPEISMYLPFLSLLSFWVLWFGSVPARCAAVEPSYHPPIEAASNEGEQAISSFQLPPDTQIALYAAEPMLANPVAIAIDEQGQVLVAETYRQGKGIEDNRGHSEWLLGDLAAQTVADRLTYFQRHSSCFPIWAS